MKKLLRFYKTQNNAAEPYAQWNTYLLAVSPIKGTHGVATVVPIAESSPKQNLEKTHVSLKGGDAGAMAKAIDHLNDLYPAGDGWQVLLEDA